ncbi:hypothetical protein [Nonomuraea sp. KM88]|uniref:hypothetical protein n=1 Tax=Nonomuraea sp. KM88 TaxID=3457427 RepID=UPI003FCD8706
MTIRNLCGGIDRMDGPLDALGETLRHHKNVVENTSGSWSKVTFDLLGSINDSVPDFSRTIDHGWEFGSQDELAGRHLRALNNDLAEIFPRFPDSVEKELPRINPQAGPEIDLTDVDLSPDRGLPESWPSSPRAGRQGGVPTGLDLGDQPDFHPPDLSDTAGDRGAEPAGPDPSPHRRDDDLAPGHGRDGDVTGRPTPSATVITTGPRARTPPRSRSTGRPSSTAGPTWPATRSAASGSPRSSSRSMDKSSEKLTF